MVSRRAQGRTVGLQAVMVPVVYVGEAVVYVGEAEKLTKAW